MEFYSQPYPNAESTKEVIVTSFGVGLFFYLFLIVLQPFDTDDFNHPYKYVLLFPYTIITFIVFSSITFGVLKNKNWTVGKEIVKVFFILFVDSIFCYLYNSLFISKVKLSLINFGYMFLYTLAIGTPITIIYVLGRYIYLKNKHQSLAAAIVHQIQKKPNASTRENVLPQTLTIVTENKKTAIILNEDDFIFAESADNYCTIHFIKEKQIAKELVRLALTNLTTQIETKSIKRCHRSYIVNLKKVISIKGNAQGYKLSLTDSEAEISVSRNYISEILPILSKSNQDA